MSIKTKTKNVFIKRPSLRIAFRYGLVAAFVMLLLAILIPDLLNYGPEFINTPFDIQMSYVPYWFQFLCIGLVLFLLVFFITFKCFKEVDKFYISTDKNKYKNIDLIKKVRKRCFNLPYWIMLFEIGIPSVSALLVLTLTGSHSIVMILKLSIMIFAFSIILAVISFIFSKEIYDEILSDTYTEGIDTGFRISLKTKILLQILPPLVFCILLLIFLGFSLSVRENEKSFFNIYNKSINETFNTNKTYTYNELYSNFENIKLLDDSHSKFIINPDNSVHVINGKQPSTFVIEYTKQISQKYDGKTYDGYGIDTQGKALKLHTNSGDYYVVVLYNVSPNSSILLLILAGIALFSVATIILYLFSKSISSDLLKISNSFDKLSSNEFGKTLPVTTNDEIGDLVKSFNTVQKYSKTQLDLIQNNQEILMEKERLATLGQMVGGIAHNLKTPIMSISGASEGLKDLITEYDKSIGDNDVTESDHHEIAKDMREWIDKIDSYSAYMSDIITAVKGQAVTLSNQEIVSFTVSELIKRVDILMKHELKHSLINMNINMNVDENLTLNGDINSLVQVLNNLISNAIHAYDGAENQKIDLDLNMEGKKLVISVTDYGKGIPEDVQKKLFKEMITTKGKNGTGLGLFMSYSNIRAHFNGIMRFESQIGKGTTFEIILPV